LTSISDFVQADDSEDLATAYVTFDALHLPVADLNVDFVFTEGSQPTTTFSATILAATVAAWQAQIENVSENADTDGEPYKTVAVPIDTAALDFGIYTMTTSVNGDELSRTVELSLMNMIFFEDWEAGFDTFVWEHSGQPTNIPNVYGDDPDEEDNSDVIADDQSLELEGTQAIEAELDTTDRHNIRLSALLAGVDFDDGMSLVVSVSKDGGQHFEEAFSISGEDAPDAFDEPFTIDLANGLKFTDFDAWEDLDPEDQVAYDNIGFDDNPNVVLRVELINENDNEDARGYIDNIDVRGT
jgi:hypothetical protein